MTDSQEVLTRDHFKVFACLGTPQGPMKLGVKIKRLDGSVLGLVITVTDEGSISSYPYTEGEVKW